jgi:hypothetical protein
LYEGNKEYYSRELSQREGRTYHLASSSVHVMYHIDKGPMLSLYCILIKEKGSTNESLAGEIGGESCGPHKHVYTSTGLEHEEHNCLLYEQANYDDMPFTACKSELSVRK